MPPLCAFKVNKFMSLKVGKAVIAALRSSDTLKTKLGAKGTAKTGARIFAVARTTEDDDIDKIPYVVVEPQGINVDSTKDENECIDTDTIDILCVDKTYSDLVDLTELVRDVISSSLVDDNGESDYDFIVNDYSFSAGAVLYDCDKPCFFQTLTYIINTQKYD